MGNGRRKAAKAAKAPARPRGRRPAGLTRRQLAELLEVHPMTVTKWEQAGLQPLSVGRKGKPSRYDEAKTRAWLAAREEAAKRGGVADLAVARARKELGAAFESEQRIKIRALEHVPIAALKKAWAFEVAAVRAAVLATYTTEADRIHRIAINEGIPGLEAYLKELGDRLLRELSLERPFAEFAPDEGLS